MNISQIVPTLNEERRIGTRLVELLRQDVSELIIVDGGSSDKTREIAQSFAPDYRGRLYVLESQRGRAVQMNHGARHAHGEVLWFVHADVKLPDDASLWVRRLLEDPRSVAGAFKTRTVKDTPLKGANLWQRAAGRCLRLADIRSRYTRLPYGDQAMFVRRQAFDAVGGFPNIPLMEDLELSRRLSRLGKFGRADAEVEVSGRRFIQHPFVDTALVNLFPLLYRAGVKPEQLAKWYRSTR